MGSSMRKKMQRKTLCIEVTTVGKKNLNPVPCPVCDSLINGISVEETSITEAKRIPVLVPAKCSNGHQVILFVDKQFTVRDVEAAGQVVEDGKDDDGSSVDKAQSWMDNF